MNADHLSLWVVYDHPKDYPKYYVARRFEYIPNPTDEVWLSESIESLRHNFLTNGLVCLLRSPEDDPCIVETWLCTNEPYSNVHSLAVSRLVYKHAPLQGVWASSN